MIDPKTCPVGEYSKTIEVIETPILTIPLGSVVRVAGYTPAMYGQYIVNVVFNNIEIQSYSFYMKPALDVFGTVNSCISTLNRLFGSTWFSWDIYKSVDGFYYYLKHGRDNKNAEDKLVAQFLISNQVYAWPSRYIVWMDKPEQEKNEEITRK